MEENAGSAWKGRSEFRQGIHSQGGDDDAMGKLTVLWGGDKDRDGASRRE